MLGIFVFIWVLTVYHSQVFCLLMTSCYQSVWMGIPYLVWCICDLLSLFSHYLLVFPFQVFNKILYLWYIKKKKKKKKKKRTLKLQNVINLTDALKANVGVGRHYFSKWKRRTQPAPTSYKLENACYQQLQWHKLSKLVRRLFIFKYDMSPPIVL